MKSVIIKRDESSGKMDFVQNNSMINAAARRESMESLTMNQEHFQVQHRQIVLPEDMTPEMVAEQREMAYANRGLYEGAQTSCSWPMGLAILLSFVFGISLITVLILNANNQKKQPPSPVGIDFTECLNDVAGSEMFEDDPDAANLTFSLNEFDGWQFLMVFGGKNFTEAKENCERLNATLAVIGSKWAKAHLNKLLSAMLYPEIELTFWVNGMQIEELALNISQCGWVQTAPDGRERSLPHYFWRAQTKINETHCLNVAVSPQKPIYQIRDSFSTYPCDLSLHSICMRPSPDGKGQAQALDYGDRVVATDEEFVSIADCGQHQIPWAISRSMSTGSTMALAQIDQLLTHDEAEVVCAEQHGGKLAVIQNALLLVQIRLLNHTALKYHIGVRRYTNSTFMDNRCGWKNTNYQYMMTSSVNEVNVDMWAVKEPSPLYKGSCGHLTAFRGENSTRTNRLNSEFAVVTGSCGERLPAFCQFRSGNPDRHRQQLVVNNKTVDVAMMPKLDGNSAKFRCQHMGGRLGVYKDWHALAYIQTAAERDLHVNAVRPWDPLCNKRPYNSPTWCQWQFEDPLTPDNTSYPVPDSLWSHDKHPYSQNLQCTFFRGGKLYPISCHSKAYSACFFQ